jgi:glutamine amidotransferase-like uncharacterized protein
MSEFTGERFNGDDETTEAFYEWCDKQQELTGADAAAYLAAEFANQTHGNYTGGTLFRRSRIHENCKITIRWENREPAQ